MLPRLVADGLTFDLAVVDGNHRFDAVFLDLVYLGRLLRPGGIVFVDDYQLPSIARAVSFFLANLGWSVEETSNAEDRHHWAVVRTSSKPDARPFDYSRTSDGSGADGRHAPSTAMMTLPRAWPVSR